MTLFKGKFLLLFVVLVSVNLHADESSIQEVIDHFLPGVNLEDLFKGQKEVTLTEAEQIEQFGRLPFSENESAEINIIVNKYETLKRRLIAREYVLRELLKMQKSEGLHSVDPIVYEFIRNGAFDVLSLDYDLRGESAGLTMQEDPWVRETGERNALVNSVLLRERESY